MSGLEGRLVPDEAASSRITESFSSSRRPSPPGSSAPAPARPWRRGDRRPADRDAQRPGVAAVRRQLRPGPAGQPLAASPSLAPSAPAAPRRPGRPSGPAARPWRRRSGTATWWRRRARWATRPIDTAGEAVGGGDADGRGHDPLQAEGGSRALVRPLAHAPGRLADAGRQAGARLVVHRLRFRVDAHPTTVATLRSKVYPIHRRSAMHDELPSRPPASRSPTARCGSRWGRPGVAWAVFALLGPTAPARPPPFGSWPPWSGPTPARPGWPASTSSPTAARCAATSLTGQFAAVDDLQTGEENLRMMAAWPACPAPRPAAGGPAAGAVRPGRGRPADGGHLVGRAGASTWPPAWSATRR